MTTFTFKDPDGKTHVVEGPDGATKEQAFQILQQRLASSAPASVPSPPSLADDLPSLDEPFVENNPEKGLLDRIGDSLSVAGDFARGTLRDITGADADPDSTVEQAQRGAGLASRTVVGAGPKVATGLGDLINTVLNVPIAGLDMASQALGDNPINTRLPTNNTAQLNAALDEIFPTPESIPERILDTGGEIALTGGATAASLAPKASAVATSPSTQGVLRNLGDDIGDFFAKTPVKASVVEGAGGVGAATGQVLSQEADLSPTGQMAATLTGGIAGGLAPQTVVNTSRRAATGVQNAVSDAFSGDIRAARTLQDAAADPAAAAAKAADAPEGVSPARATEEPGVQALERRVLDDDPVAAARVAADLEGAEKTTLRELADQFGEGTDRAAWQQEVIVRGAPDNAEIRVGQPDEMLDDAAKAFGDAYDDAAGFPVRTENMQVEGGNTSLREAFGEATSNSSIIADKKWRKGIANFLEGLLDDITGSGKPIGAADSGVAEVDSSVLLDMRSTIRAEARRRAKAGVNNPRAAAEAEMLQAANRAVTDVLESQLPAEASVALRATDNRYRDFVTVQNAVLRSGEKGLTPEALRAAVRASNTAGNVARGNTGELGRLAETGRDAAQTLGKPDQAARLTRDMTPEQLSAAKSDFNQAIIDKATPGDGLLRGKKYLEQLEQNTETLKAAGFTDGEIGQMRRVGQQLEMIQSKSPAAVVKLLEDDVGNVMRLLGAIAGSKSGSRLLKILGGAGGAGPSLIVSQFGSKVMQNTLTRLSVDKADELIRAAMTDKELFNALMTRPTASLKAQADAARTVQAWLARTAPDGESDE